MTREIYIPLSKIKELRKETGIFIMKGGYTKNRVCFQYALSKKGNKEVERYHLFNNSKLKHLESYDLVLVIFNGPHCYISPSWYKNSGVPTWDYVSVHAYGNAKIIDNEKTVQLIEELSDKYEYAQEAPWKAAGNYSTKILNAIKGFEITVQKLKGKVKIGQNKSRDDLIGVLDALEKSPFEQEKAIAKLIKKHLDSKE